MNPIIKDIGKLLKTIRNSDVETIKEARQSLQDFTDSWIVDGTSKDLEGAGSCCLSDTDVTGAIIPSLDVWIDVKSSD